MSTTALLLAYAFPPENISGAARPYRFYRSLPEHDVTPIVFTASAQTHESQDIYFIRDIPRDLPRQTLSWQVERVIRKLLLPGELGLTWSRRVAHECRDFVRKNNRCVVLSTSPPLSTHLAAYQVKRKYGMPWIADFRDPLNPTAKISVSRLNIYSILETFILKNADAIIANTDAVHAEWCKRYPALQHKFHVIWNGFDPADAVSPAQIANDGIVHVTHVGELYGGGHPGPILDSIQRLCNRNELKTSNFRLSLIGLSSDDVFPDIRVLHDLVNSGIVEYVPKHIPSDEARSIASRANGLLLLQPQSDVQVPAKLFEYIRIGRPILAYIKRNSPSDRILLNSGIPYRTIYPDDTPDAIDAKLLEFICLPSHPVRANDWFFDNFNARNQAHALSDIIHSLTFHAP